MTKQGHRLNVRSSKLHRTTPRVHILRRTHAVKMVGSDFENVSNSHVGLPDVESANATFTCTGL